MADGRVCARKHGRRLRDGGEDARGDELEGVDVRTKSMEVRAIGVGGALRRGLVGDRASGLAACCIVV